jgi:hypothetical protein
MTRPTLAIGGIVAMCLGTRGAAQSGRQGVVHRSPSGVTLRVILDDSHVGSEVSRASTCAAVPAGSERTKIINGP